MGGPRDRAGRQRTLSLCVVSRIAALLRSHALLVFVLALVGGVAITDLFLVKLGVTMAFIPVMISYTRKNRPRSFDPAAIPADALPGG